MPRSCCAALVIAGLLALPFAATAASDDVEVVRPSVADPRIAHYDEDDVVMVNRDAGPSAPLVVYLPGTHGRPQANAPLLQVIAVQGYRVISLAYNDEPSVSQVCPRDPDPDCARAFRQKRAFGDGTARVDNPPCEAIVSRLTTLLTWLDRHHPDDGWGTYLDADRQPAWTRIVLTGLSQGAGMAAFIAKQHAVRRVVLFSSPWDTTGDDRRPAPWLSTPSATPMDRWWAERHAREATTELIAHAYAALAIPPDHVLLFDRPLASRSASTNPFHGSTIRDSGYAPEWRRLFGPGDR